MGGRSIAKLLLDDYGLIFVAGYLVSFMVVSFGIFNVISAIYVEVTIEASKNSVEKSKRQRDRESVRVARITKELLKLSFEAERVYSNGLSLSRKLSRRVRTCEIDEFVGARDED